MVCLQQGKADQKDDANETSTEKTSMRTGCKAQVKAQFAKDKQSWFFEYVDLNHNHPLSPTPRMTRFMHAHKNRDEGIINIFNILAKCGVPYQAAMNVMSELHGGRRNMNFTEKDMKNRYILKT